MFDHAVRALGLAATLTALVAAPGCAAPADEDEAASGDFAWTDADAACYAEAPRSGESETSARARCLTKLVGPMLTRAAESRPATVKAALPAYAGKISVRDGSCFSEDGGNWVTNYQISSKRDVAMLKRQLEYAVELLADLHEDLDGYPNHVFASIGICPEGQAGGDLVLEGSRLMIGVRMGFAGRIAVHDARALRDKWKRGEHLEADPVLSRLGPRWALLDPAGTPRSIMRRTLRSAARKLAERLSAIAARGGEQARPALTQLVRESVIATAEDDRGDNLASRAAAHIAALPADQLAAFARSWAEAADVSVQDGVEDGAVMLQDVGSRQNLKIKVTQSGFVNVNNFKDIDVDVSVMLPKGRAFARFVALEKSETTVTVNQIGFVNVQLNDHVKVRLSVVYDRAVETASLDRVLTR